MVLRTNSLQIFWMSRSPFNRSNILLTKGPLVKSLRGPTIKKHSVGKALTSNSTEEKYAYYYIVGRKFFWRTMTLKRGDKELFENRGLWQAITFETHTSRTFFKRLYLHFSRKDMQQCHATAIYI